MLLLTPSTRPGYRRLRRGVSLQQSGLGGNGPAPARQRRSAKNDGPPTKPIFLSKLTSTVRVKNTIETGIPFFDHMLEQIARHGFIDLEVYCKGDLHIDEPPYH